MRAARTDDLSNAKKNILRFMPNVADVPGIGVDHPKEERGFHHFATGRLLCPALMLGEFDEDPEK